jgi:hypothetical protein
MPAARRNVLVFMHAVAELTVVIVSPRPKAAVGIEGERMVATS